VEGRTAQRRGRGGMAKRGTRPVIAEANGGAKTRSLHIRCPRSAPAIVHESKGVSSRMALECFRDDSITTPLRRRHHQVLRSPRRSEEFPGACAIDSSFPPARNSVSACGVHRDSSMTETRLSSSAFKMLARKPETRTAGMALAGQLRIL
jgi:hypothetical protein